MTPFKWLIAYLGGLAVFLALDMFWLGFLARGLYARHFGDLMAPEVNWTAAGVFYLLFLSGVIVFVVRPALTEGSIRQVLGSGAFFGLVTYATYDLTNLATLRGFPAGIVLIDLAWGATLTAVTSLSLFLFIRKLSR